jgi:hypothetical protein
MNAPLTGCTTIDATTPDGYLDNARAGNPQADGNLTTEEAANNLLACEGAAPRAANIVGHGAEGDIDTGKALGQCITNDNVHEWTPLMEGLDGKISELFLFGCTVGAGDDGADLLYEIATVISAPVSAPTGLIYCDAAGVFTLEPGAVWQTATPAARPAPIDPPVHGQAAPMNNTSGAAPSGASSPLQVLSASYTRKGDKGPESDHLSEALAQEVLWSQPFTPKGEPGAKVTGHLHVEIVLNGKRQKLSLLVHNHVLLKDAKTATYYHATPKFRALLRQDRET